MTSSSPRGVFESCISNHRYCPSCVTGSGPLLVQRAALSRYRADLINRIEQAHVGGRVLPAAVDPPRSSLPSESASVQPPIPATTVACPAVGLAAPMVLPAPIVPLLLVLGSFSCLSSPVQEIESRLYAAQGLAQEERHQNRRPPKIIGRRSRRKPQVLLARLPFRRLNATPRATNGLPERFTGLNSQHSFGKAIFSDNDGEVGAFLVEYVLQAPRRTTRETDSRDDSNSTHQRTHERAWDRV